MVNLPQNSPVLALGQRRSARVGRALAITLGAVAFAAIASAAPASADLKLCNTTTSRIGVAIGYQDAQGWTTEGWWNIAAQTCETLYRGTLSAKFYYVHAVDYDRGGEWAGQSFMCSAEKSFTIRGDQDCQKRGFKRTGFFEVDTGDAKDWTIRLTDPGEAPPAPAPVAQGVKPK